MVSIIPAERTPFDVIGKNVARGISEHFPAGFEQGMNRGLLQKSLDEIRNLSQSKDASPLDITLAAMKAGAGIPGSERYLGAIIPELVKFAEARRSQGITMPGEVPGMGGEGFQQQQRQPLPGFMQQPGQMGQQGQKPEFFPTNIGPQEATGNLPQAATTGEVVPLLNRNQRIQEAKRLSAESTREGIPLSVPQAMAQVNEDEELKKLQNYEVEKERVKRVESQREYGQKAADFLVKSLPEATEEQKAIFKKKGEEAAAQGKSEAEIDRYLANEARKFSNTISNIRSDLSAPRLQNTIQRKFLGTEKQFKQAASDLRSHLRPILDMGLYDTARNLLTDLGYYPEEREQIINPFSDKETTMMNRVPDANRVFEEENQFAPRKALQFHKPYEYPNYDAEKDNIKSGLKDLRTSNPNFSLPLARKAFEDKKYDWRIFKEAFNEFENELIDSGSQLTDDQQIQRTVLDSPPLNSLEKLLHGLNLIGR